MVKKKNDNLEMEKLLSEIETLKVENNSLKGLSDETQKTFMEQLNLMKLQLSERDKIIEDKNNEINIIKNNLIEESKKNNDFKLLENDNTNMKARILNLEEIKEKLQNQFLELQGVNEVLEMDLKAKSSNDVEVEKIRSELKSKNAEIEKLLLTTNDIKLKFQSISEEYSKLKNISEIIKTKHGKSLEDVPLIIDSLIEYREKISTENATIQRILVENQILMQNLKEKSKLSEKQMKEFNNMKNDILTLNETINNLSEENTNLKSKLKKVTNFLKS